jgi:hypothetical protein
VLMEVVNRVLLLVACVLIVFCFWFTRLGCECDESEMEVMRGVVVATSGETKIFFPGGR